MGIDAMASDVPRAGQSFRSMRARAAMMYDRSAVLPRLQMSGQRVFPAAQLTASASTRSLNPRSDSFSISLPYLRPAFYCTLAVALLLARLESRVSASD